MTITVSADIRAPLDLVWESWSNPDDIMQWNAASDDWHTTSASVDLRAGGRFCSRMEAKDGSMGFDFEGEYLTVEPKRLIVSRFGGRALRVEFAAKGDHVTVTETFEPEDVHSLDLQQQGWQAILDRFKRHVESKV